MGVPLSNAFADGSVLASMLKVFAQVDYSAKNPRGLAQMQDQVTRELQLFRAANWPSEIESQNLIEKDEKHRRAILGWIWQVISFAQLMNYGAPKGSHDVAEVYKWVDRYLADAYPDHDPGDAAKGLSAFQDGKILSYLVHCTDPNAIKLGQDMYSDPVEKVTTRALDAASFKLGVPALIVSDDIIGAHNDKSLITYLTAFRETVERKDDSIYDWVETYLGGEYSDVPEGYPQKGLPSFQDGRLMDYLVDKSDPNAIDLSAQESRNSLR